ncbi:MAG TPA: hypothetical protein VH309_13370 [Elusimicrobiota bacterium]|jgi:hypothetical protein|nr:hypothetical protein [Elusimicrobiota bacterium]
MKPHKKPGPTAEAKPEHVRTVDEQNEEQWTNEPEEEGGGYARPRSRDVPGEERPCRGGS